MTEKTINYNNKELIRINYTKVKNIINNKSKLKKDIIIYTLPNKANHKSPWINGFFEIEVPKSNIYRDSVYIFNEINEIIYYNCNKELGSYLKFYIERGVNNELSNN